MKAPAIALLLAMSASAATAQTRPAATDSSADRQAALRELEAETSKLVQLSVRSPEEIVRFELKDKFLTLSSPIKPQPEEIRIVIPDLSGIMRMRWYKGEAEINNPNFHLIQHDLTSATKRQVITMLSNVGGRVLVTRDGESEKAAPSIQYIQDPPPSPDMPESPELPVKLYVRSEQANSNQPPLDLKLTASSFEELRQRHPDEVDQYLRPILRQFNQEAGVFGVPTQAAWQVLGSGGGADEQTLANVKAVLARLESDDFRERQKANEELKQMGNDAARALLSMNRAGLTPEQNSAIDSFLASAAPLAGDESKRRREDKQFLLDVLYVDDANLRELALQQLSKVTGQPVKLDPSLPPAERARAITKLREQILPMTRPATGMLE